MGHSKAVWRGKFVILSAYIRNEKRSQISTVSYCIERLEKGQKLKASRGRKERAEINEIEHKKTIENINETKSWIFLKDQ